jgi:3-hydroxyisobutyrate dehydrogenase-like beta-hydroxyacid dehydrogenase
MTTTKKSDKISIIGLGQMGRKLAQLYVDAGFEVTVWNRSKGKASDLTKVKMANTFFEAVTNSSLIIICVSDNAAVFGLLESVSDINKIFTGKTVLNLTTGSPTEADEIEAFIISQGGSYINGALQVAPDQMGLKDTTILMSGAQNAFLESKYSLDVLGGNIKYLGEKAAASSAMDLATLTWLYGSYVGLIYGVELSRQYGLKLEDFSSIIEEVTPGYTTFFKHQIDVINRGDYRITQSPLSISVAATRRIANSFKELDVMQEFPENVARILAEADRKGLYNEELAAIIKVIEKQKAEAMNV